MSEGFNEFQRRFSGFKKFNGLSRYVSRGFRSVLGGFKSGPGCFMGVHRNYKGVHGYSRGLTSIPTIFKELQGHSRELREVSWGVPGRFREFEGHSKGV